MARFEKLQPRSASRRPMIPQPARLGERLEDLGINYAGRRGRCLAEIDLMIIWPGFALSNGLAERSSARFISALTAGLSKSAALSRTMWRTCLPPPFSRFCGSGRSEPRKKKRLTHRGYSAIEKITSDERSVGLNPMASAL